VVTVTHFASSSITEVSVVIMLPVADIKMSLAEITQAMSSTLPTTVVSEVMMTPATPGAFAANVRGKPGATVCHNAVVCVPENAI